jgi:hypothetical protein
VTTETAQRNPFKQREALRADIARARQAADTLRAKLARLDAERKDADAAALREEMEILAGSDGATERRDAAVERIHTVDRARPEHERGLTAAEQLMQIREAQLTQLHDECFEDFAREADSYATAAVRDLEELRAQVVRAAQSWAKATALWRPLNGPLRRRLEELNSAGGHYPNVAPQAVVQPFPVQLPSDLASLAPRPSGLARLTQRHDALR